MRKKIIQLSVFMLSCCFIACNNNQQKTEKKETTENKGKDGKNISPENKNTNVTSGEAAAIAKQWCDLNSKADKASDADLAAAEKALEDFEKMMEQKYGNNDALMAEIEKEVEKCETASEQ